MLSEYGERIQKATRALEAFLGGYEALGTLIVDGGTVSLETGRGEIVLDETYVIEVYSDGKYHPITYDQARSTISSDGWPLYAGLEARVKAR
ncbi:hypothetical protein ACPVTF_03995 [Geobacillus icigianus]|uniref:Uncharacterized protein n=1 Tax=Geobacillus subterraneus TaxID=129338 RepID=A0A679FL52_9BACL|nr:hypothetical protein [Geobacillus subterraneus]BBW97262.1 hypothetical protein GsuE55_20950 [Geobacillus subterraneus]